MSKRTKAFLGILLIACAVVMLTVLTLAAYFAKGVFKDVFVNKEDYFSADLLYSISSVDATKREIGSAGAHCEINVYNHDVSSGDFNAFDVTFDVYAWLEAPLTDGKSYTLYDGSGNSVDISTTEHTASVMRGIVLSGGKLSTATLAVDFNYQDDEELTDAPGLHLVVVPSDPKRLSSSYLGALIRPIRSDAFAVNYDFDHTGRVEDYAAFTYRVSTVGNAQLGDKIVVKWKSDALVLIHMNGEEPNITKVQEGDFGNGFDRMIEWDVQSNNTDSFVFFRNTENEMWKAENQDWDLLRSQISTEYVKNSTQG